MEQLADNNGFYAYVDDMDEARKRSLTNHGHAAFMR